MEFRQNKTKNALGSLRGIVADNLLEVEKKIRKLFFNFKNLSPDINKKDIKMLSGKRIRPTLVFIAAKIFQRGKWNPTQKQDLLSVAISIELFHIASLIHDDIIDKSLIRHNYTSLYAKLGRDPAIVIGDWILSLAFAELSCCNNKIIRTKILKALTNMCQGELKQIFMRGHLKLSQKTYNEIIKLKTASLFAVSCWAGAYLTSHSSYLAKTMYVFGLHFGIVFQLMDDLNDLIGSSAKIGKPTMQDVFLRELTLPLIIMKDKISTKENTNFERKLSPKRKIKKNGIKNIRYLFYKSGALADTKKIMLYHLHKSLQILKTLPQTRVTRCLKMLVQESETLITSV